MRQIFRTAKSIQIFDNHDRRVLDMFHLKLDKLSTL